MQNSNSQNGVGFTGLLTIVFVVLKLCKVITWSWWWVVSPLWISALLVILVLFIVLIFSVITSKK